MTRKERTWILIEDETQVSKQIADQVLLKHQMNVIEKPHVQLVMNKVRESAHKSLFYVGEVLVSVCRVKIDTAFGEGIIIGEHDEKAFELAVIDAGFKVADDAQLALWYNVLDKAKQLIIRRMKLHKVMIDQTKVSFDTMEVGEES